MSKDSELRAHQRMTYPYTEREPERGTVTSTPQDMPAAYLPLREGDLVKLNGRDAVVLDPAVAGSVTVAVMVEPAELIWVARYRGRHQGGSK